MHLAAIILDFTKIYNNYYSTPSVKKSGFGLSHGDLLCVHLFIGDPDLLPVFVYANYCWILFADL